MVSTVCPYPVVIQFCSCHAAFTEEDVGLCETLVPPNLMLYHRFTLFKYAVHIGVNPSLPDTPCRNLLNMVIDNGYLSHTVMSHSIQIMFRLAQCLSHFSNTNTANRRALLTLSKAKKKQNCREEYRHLEKHHGGGVLLIGGLYNHTARPYCLPGRLEWCSSIILRHAQIPAQDQCFDISQMTLNPKF